MNGSRSPRPYGIGAQHDVNANGRLRNIAAVVVIGGILAAGLSGVLGGGAQTVARARGAAVEANVRYYDTLRSGNWFETQVSVTARAPVADLTMTVAAPLWEGLSIDTMAPDAESAEFVDGGFRYHFGKVDPGETFRIKLDGQIQPRAFRVLAGDMTIGDDERPLARVPLRVTVLP